MHTTITRILLSDMILLEFYLIEPQQLDFQVDFFSSADSNMMIWNADDQSKIDSMSGIQAWSQISQLLIILQWMQLWNKMMRQPNHEYY
jgi:hypothetical protein